MRAGGVRVVMSAIVMRPAKSAIAPAPIAAANTSGAPHTTGVSREGPSSAATSACTMPSTLAVDTSVGRLPGSRRASFTSVALSPSGAPTRPRDHWPHCECRATTARSPVRGPARCRHRQRAPCRSIEMRWRERAPPLTAATMLPPAPRSIARYLRGCMSRTSCRIVFVAVHHWLADVPSSQA